MSSPRDFSLHSRARAAVIRVASLALAAVAAAGLVVLNPAVPEQAGAAGSTTSELSIKWTGDESAAKPFQPLRDTGSAHFAEFKNISITVSQTTGIIDQAIRVSAKGFLAGTVTSADNTIKNSMNYLQAMQCWGDPSAANFRQTCEWGGRYSDNNGIGNSVLLDNTLRVASQDLDLDHPTTVDNPFLTAQLKSVSGKLQRVDGVTKYSILDYFTPATTNEVTSARIGNDAEHSGRFDFEAQTADQAPQLGCGTAKHLRCWLVVVPRGTVFGGNGEECSSFLDPLNGFEPYAKGRKGSVQGGSPMNPGCDYWDNRMVVPLDFSPVGLSCAIGSQEQSVVGSELMVSAMSSWQPDLCARLKATYSFATNPDSIARSQLLKGKAGIAFTGLPLSPGQLENNDERQSLAETKLSYAPVAISGVAIAFFAESDSGRQTSLRLSARLMAKLLTQSYPFQIPTNSGDTPDKAIAHLPAKNRMYRYLNQDPEFQKLNPDNYRFFTENPGLALPGPSGADSIRQLWRWILSDTDAVAFLDGQPDPSGMAVNPYYLPAGAPNATVPTFTKDGDFALADGKRVMEAVGLANIDGTPLKLSESTLDTFIKADKTLAPLKLQAGQKYPFDSIQYSPFTNNLLGSARAAFRADPNSKSIWDPTKINPAGEVGDWVSSGAQAPGQKFMIAVTDTPSVIRYGLDAAALQVPKSQSFVTPNDESFAAALAALKPTTQANVLQIDPSAVPVTGYPLTIVTYSAVNLTESTAASRKTISELVSQITTTGQMRGNSTGQLPDGYLPITKEMATLAAVSAAEIRSYVPEAVTATNGPAQDDYAGSAFDDGVSAAGGPTESNPALAAVPGAAQSQSVKDPEVSPITRAGLAISLGLGLGGALFGPILFKGRGFL